MSDPWNMVAELQQWQEPPVTLGPHTSFQYRHDPKHLAFVLARYKFVAKMLEGQDRVLEIGCGDGFGTAIVAQAVGHVDAIDTDARLTRSAREHAAPNCVFLSPTDTFGPGYPPRRGVDAIYSIDVLEHLLPGRREEEHVLADACAYLRPPGVLILGTPNATAAPYASESSKLGHVNLKTAAELRDLMHRYFGTVFLFGMNDEVVHTGFLPMAHYLWAVGVGVR